MSRLFWWLALSLAVLITTENRILFPSSSFFSSSACLIFPLLVLNDSFREFLLTSWQRHFICLKMMYRPNWRWHLKKPVYKKKWGGRDGFVLFLFAWDKKLNDGPNEVISYELNWENINDCCTSFPVNLCCIFAFKTQKIQILHILGLVWHAQYRALRSAEGDAIEWAITLHKMNTAWCHTFLLDEVLPVTLAIMVWFHRYVFFSKKNRETTYF